ncbi:hypothetical protein SDC9_201519 [bioreactor metagenome]|uniref:Uncharacterized protein n=1 Tax=bioreactor metagenome TaxID=1076179 RepID=A0A645IR60_9ZZZZ
MRAKLAGQRIWQCLEQLLLNAFFAGEIKPFCERVIFLAPGGKRIARRSADDKAVRENALIQCVTTGRKLVITRLIH